MVQVFELCTNYGRFLQWYGFDFGYKCSTNFIVSAVDSISSDGMLATSETSNKTDKAIYCVVGKELQQRECGLNCD